MTIVVDTSAVVALLTREPEAAAVAAAVESADERVMSAATLVELGIVLEARLGPVAVGVVERFLREGDITVLDLTRTHADRAVDAWRTFGRGRHRASLNYGDCFTYGLAAELGAAVLCVGDDFPSTDIPVVPLPA